MCRIQVMREIRGILAGFGSMEKNSMRRIQAIWKISRFWVYRRKINIGNIII